MKQIKLRVLLLLLIAASVQSVSSQIRLGVKGGVDVINHKISSSILKVNNRLGYQIGLGLEVLPFNGFGVEAGLLYGHKKYDVESRNTSGVDADISDYNYISIPINLKKRFNITSSLGIYGVAGAYGAVKLQGGDLNVSDVSRKFKSKDFQAGIGAGFGVTLLGNIDIGLNFRYKVTDNYDIDRPDLDNFKNLEEKHGLLAQHISSKKG